MTDTEKWKAKARYTLDVADHEPDCTCTHCVYAIGVAAALAEAYTEGERGERERTIKLLGNANDKKLITNGQYSYLWDVMHHD